MVSKYIPESFGEDMRMAVLISRKMEEERREIKEKKRKEDLQERIKTGNYEYYEVCKHTRLENMNGGVFCGECGLFERYELMNELCTDFEYHFAITHRKTINTPVNPPKDSSLNEHSKVKELREAAKKLGFKYTTTMSKKRLCEILGIEISNEGKYVLKNLKTGEEHKFKNIKEISTEFNICLGLISYYMGKNITIGENTYSLEKL